MNIGKDMEKPSKFQKSVVEEIEGIGDAITVIEGLCHNIEKLDPVLINNVGGISYTQPIINFIINHRKYTIWYNEMRDFLLNELLNGAYITSQKELEVMLNL